MPTHENQAPPAIPARQGLSAAEAARRLATEGPNLLPGSAPKSTLAIVRDVVTEPMFLMLLAAGSIYLALGDRGEALFLLGFVFVVIGITLAQERKTQRALESLRDLSAPRALVIRDGQEQRIAGREVVRGDLLVLHEGDRIAADALLIVVVTEVVSLGLIKAPGEMGADIVVGEGQSIGNGLNFGGPYLGLFATRDKYVRQMPGRLCGETVDADGKRGFVLTLSTREQHIRREKATSNICTNSGLCALAFSIHMTLLGESGLRKLAALNHARAVQLADRLGRIPGVEVVTRNFFNEFTIRLPQEARPVVRKLAEKGVLAGVSLGRL